jgi:hypothetical protein
MSRPNGELAVMVALSRLLMLQISELLSRSYPIRTAPSTAEEEIIGLPDAS